MERKKRRSTGKIDRLPAALRAKVEGMISAGNTYQEIKNFLETKGVTLSLMAVSNYSRKFLKVTEELRAAQERFAILVEETNRNPNLDITESLLRLTTNHLLKRISDFDEKDWESVDLETTIKAIQSLAKVTAQKRRTDMLNNTATKRAGEYYKALLHDTIAKKRPELYKQLQEALDEELEEREYQGADD